MGISEELYILLNAVWTGINICIVYESLSCFRKVVKHKDWVVSIQDFGFWIFTSVYMFARVFSCNNGKWRWYYFIGIVVGVWAIHIIWGRIEKTCRKIRKTLKNKGKTRIIK